MLPEGHVVHQGASRFRLRFPSLKGNLQRFKELEGQLRRSGLVKDVSVNPITGSVLVSHSGEMNDVLAFATKNQLFQLAETELEKTVVVATLATYKVIDNRIKDLSGGALDLPSIAFLGFLGTGLYQVARKGFSPPAWHNALWYAFNVFMKARRAEKEG